MPLAASNVAALHDVAPVHLAGRCQRFFRHKQLRAMRGRLLHLPGVSS